jgi:Leucine-rich repeat (LRR) protein
VTKLPTLPRSLQELDVHESQVATLPALPSSLKQLNLSGSQVRSNDPVVQQAIANGAEVIN